jgi:recombination protein RecA
VKNKVAPPFRLAEFDILYGTGISYEGELIDLGVIHNVIDKSGTWFSYGKERLGQGKDNARKYLSENDELRAEIDAKVREALGLIAPPDEPSAEEAPDK